MVYIFVNWFENKKVLLHTNRRVAVASACYSGEGGPGMGYPPCWGTPRLGYPPSWGTPPTGLPHPLTGVLPLAGYPPTWTWDGVPPLPWPGMRYPPTWTWDGVPPYLDLGWVPPLPRTEIGYPLPRPEMGYPPKVNRQTFPSIKYYLPSYYVRGR